MLFNWWKKGGRPQSDEWPQFTDSSTGPLMSSSQPQARSLQGDARFAPKAEEDIVAAARLVY